MSKASAKRRASPRLSGAWSASQLKILSSQFFSASFAARRAASSSSYETGMFCDWSPKSPSAHITAASLWQSTHGEGPWPSQGDEPPGFTPYHSRQLSNPQQQLGAI